MVGSRRFFQMDGPINSMEQALANSRAKITDLAPLYRYALRIVGRTKITDLAPR
jgi:hypothetical protein